LSPFDETQSKFRVSLVLNPSTWLAACHKVLSWYIKGSASNSSCFDPFKQLNTWESLESFVAEYLEKIPGSIGKMFDSYEADSCIKTEDLPHAFEELMFSLGYKPISVNYPLLASAPPNYNSRLPFELHDKVIQAEKEFCLKYDYY
jgi:hypothetical protein